MLKCIAYVLLILSLLVSPVIAGYTSLESPTHACGIADADDGKAGGNHDQLASDHHCCTVHSHYGNVAPDESPVPSLMPTRLRLPLLADPLLAAFGPSPLLEPPSLA